MEETQTQPNTGDNNINHRLPWSFQANWTVSGGSLDSSVTVESFDLPIQSDNNTSPKPPLFLQPSFYGSGPCEIKISFTQKHEIRQVYVRSTARVYEIYYGSSAQSEDEYLCTVRCSIASKEDELLHTSDIQGASPAEVKMVGGSNTSPREDDWVEVKIPTTATRSFRSQDFYEATAEISDVDPCMSITLRLLSLQSKGCVYVDEVYVFADTVELANSEHQAVQVGNSTGTNLMAMLVPTLMQLTKSRASDLEDKHVSRSKEKQEYREIETGESSTAKINVKLQETYGATIEPNHFQVSVEAPKSEKYDTVSKTDHSCIQVERVLEQLVSRMSRIEDICLRFEENMVKPINSMLERLERVEQQMEVLAKNSPCPPRLPSGTIFTAPEFSNESNSSSFNEGNSSQSCGPTEKKNITTIPDISSQPDDKSTSVCFPRFLPSLTVTAPEFTCCDDDEEENVVLEPQKVSPEGKPNQTMSIDDALAAALAGFSSTALVQSPNYEDAFTTKNPKFTSEENGGDVLLESSKPPAIQLSSGVADNDEPVLFKVAAPEFTGEEKGNEGEVSESDHQKGKSLGHSGSFRIEEIMSENLSISTSAHDAFIETATRQISNLVSDHMEGTSEVVDCSSTVESNYRFTEGSTEPEKNNLTNKISVSDNISDVTHTESLFDKEISSIKAISSYPSILDFESPILEVKFASCDKSSANSSLEALLTDTTEIYVKDPQLESDGVENGEAISSRQNCLLVELEDGYGVEEVSMDMVGDAMRDQLTRINQEAFASLI